MLDTRAVMIRLVSLLDKSNFVAGRSISALDEGPGSLGGAVDRKLAETIVLLVEDVGDRQSLVRREGGVALYDLESAQVDSMRHKHMCRGSFLIRRNKCIGDHNCV